MSTLISCNNTISSALFEITRSVRESMLHQRIVGYTPDKAPMGVSSLVKTPGIKRTISSTSNYVIVPRNAIIDRVEFVGFDGFSAGRIEIGLGTFNSPINFPLISNTTAEIANELIGGIKDFRFDELTGSNDHAVVTQDSYINICTTTPITGFLQVAIYFHLRPEVPVVPPRRD
uniref:Capsid protein n=1 Tax=Heteronotia binoei irido-like virus TaxID=3141948 RepID=A0AAU7SS97_9VIRU